jgi:hypothetical protein
MYSWAHSEPLYIFLSIVCLFGVTWLSTISKSRFLLVMAAMFVGAAILTRYIGISLLTAGFIGLLILNSDHDRKSRWQEALYFLILSIIPISIFLIRNILLTGSPTNRPAPFWHPPDPEEWIGGIKVFLEWILPSNVVLGMKSLVSILTFILFLSTMGLLAYPSLRSRSGKKDSSRDLSKTLISIVTIYLFAYVSFVVITVVFLDTMTLLNQRILSPIYLPGLIFILIVGWRWWKKTGKAAQILIGIFLIVLFGNQIWRTNEKVDELRIAPRGYASGIYRNSPTVEYVQQLPNVPIYSNDLPALYFWADRMAIFIPSRINPSTLMYGSNEQYEQSLQQMRQRMSQEEAVLIIFGPDPYNRLEQNHLSDLTRDLILVAEFIDGLVFQYKGDG